MLGNFYILTLGCQMNKNDSERVAGLLLSLGMKEMAEPEEADFLIINTCSVRQSAEDRVCGFVKNWQNFRKKKPNLIIAITGCMPGRDKDGKLRQRIKGVDLFFGIEELPMLPKWLGELGGKIRENYLEIEPKREKKYQVAVTIQTGCNNFCTYCVVPYARGREKNRSVKDILKEIKKAVAKGAIEVILLGQVVNNYRAPDAESFSPDNPLRKNDFAALLWEINQIEGLKRLHWTAADPQYFDETQIMALTLPKQVNYLHLPVQGGDNAVLKRMNRHYTKEQYVELVEKIRAARPGIALGTDIIVGFPGENNKQFEETMDLYHQCDFDIAYLAKYSERSGTAAAKAFKDDVPRAEKKRRWEALQNLMEKTVFRKNQKFLGQTADVLVEKYADGVCIGNTNEMKLAQFLGGPELVGKIVKIKITQPKMWILSGILLD